MVGAAKRFCRVNCPNKVIFIRTGEERISIGMINCRTSGLGLRGCFPVASSRRSCLWEAIEAVEGRDLGSEYSELRKFPKFPTLLCVGNFGKIGVWFRFSVFGAIYGFGRENCQPGRIA